MKNLDFKHLQLNKHFKHHTFVGTLALRYVKEHFNTTDISGALKHKKLFIATSDQSLKIEIFKQKKALIQWINEKLQRLGYEVTIDDVYITLSISTQDEEYL